MPKYEKHICEKFDIKYIKQYKKEGPEESEHNSILLVPDTLSEEEYQHIQKIYSPKMRIVSIFWLYISCDLLYQLPLEPFERIKVAYFDGEREQSSRF